ncbi:hypothetical protein T4E_9566 [Trichinella pseudospiralis]|uniref:Uncharacterized protein n=1 Tax=Trichinella pseudospiralis TaxID=6337 RepID=A0A0V1G5X1_TRIPS|nr:hypothetical protein T4E_9566 [Trichinella pseudospiralis]KRY93506.1 hypothetical protein T4D_10842 [Trichinella pseudospiralis]
MPVQVVLGMMGIERQRCLVPVLYAGQLPNSLARIISADPFSATINAGLHFGPGSSFLATTRFSAAKFLTKIKCMKSDWC